LQQLRVGQRIKCFPAQRRFRQPTISSICIETDRPKFVVRRLTQLHLGHPVKNFARVQIAKDASLKLQKKWRMNRVTEIQQRIWSSQSIEQRWLRHSYAANRVEIMRAGCRFLIQQTIATSQSMQAQLPLEVINSGLIGVRVICRRQELEPDCIELQSTQAKHPLQRNGKISASFAIFGGKAASEENCHASRIVILLASSSSKGPDLEDSRQTCSGRQHLGLPRLAGAKSAVRDRDNRAEELRLLPYI
jgi:hypothetical protein